MRAAFFIIFSALVVTFGICASKAVRSPKSIGRAVGLLLCALIPPVIGNAIIIISGDKTLSTVGYYIYFLGMNCTMLALIFFTDAYCMILLIKQDCSMGRRI